MADDLTPLVNLEDDAPAPAAPPPAPVAAAPVAEPPPVELPPDPDEAEAVELPGGKHVPLAALKTVREENKHLRSKATQADQLAMKVAQLEGQLQGYQQVAQQLQQPRQSAPAAPQTNAVALKFAQSLDLYRPDGNGQAIPDVEKAEAILGIVKEMAKQEAGNLVGPIAQTTARERSVRNYQWARTVKDPNGKTVPQSVVDDIWRSFPTEFTSDENIAKTLVYTAMGMDRMHAQPQPVAPPPPVHTDSVGVPARKVAMSDLETRVAQNAGIKPEKWQEHTKGWKPGHTTVLED